MASRSLAADERNLENIFRCEGISWEMVSKGTGARMILCSQHGWVAGESCLTSSLQNKSLECQPWAGWMNESLHRTAPLQRARQLEGTTRAASSPNRSAVLSWTRCAAEGRCKMF